MERSSHASSNSSTSHAMGADAAAGPEEVAREISLALQCIPIPESFKCPMTLEILQDPVATVDGHVYERAAITQWFQRGSRLSPLTNLPLPAITLTPEVPLKRAIEEYTRMRPDLERTALDWKSLQSIAATREREIQQKLRSIPLPPALPREDALLNAVRDGNVAKCMETLIHPKFNGVNHKDANSRTALHFAAAKGMVGAAFAILEHRDFTSAWAEADFDGSGGSWTAVELAVRGDHHALAAALQAFLNSFESQPKLSHRHSRGCTREGRTDPHVTSSHASSLPSELGSGSSSDHRARSPSHRHRNSRIRLYPRVTSSPANSLASGSVPGSSSAMRHRTCSQSPRRRCSPPRRRRSGNELDDWIDKNDIDDRCADYLRQQPEETQKAVLEMGDCYHLRNPSAVVFARIRKCLSGTCATSSHSNSLASASSSRHPTHSRSPRRRRSRSRSCARNSHFHVAVSMAASRVPLPPNPWSQGAESKGKGKGDETCTAFQVKCDDRYDGDDEALKFLSGIYVRSGRSLNHGKRVFRRLADQGHASDIFLYYWDEREGDEFYGWCFGEKVGSSHVWSRCVDASDLPPRFGWRVPWDGEVRGLDVMRLTSQDD